MDVTARDSEAKRLEESERKHEEFLKKRKAPGSNRRIMSSCFTVSKVPRETHDTPINPRMTPAFSRSYSVEW